MDNYLLISDAAKEVNVESHVLRYWEEELHLPIKRNELGHRYYTEEDVKRFKQIKGMKERGLQLKAIKMILKDGKLDVLSGLPGEMEESGKAMPSREKGEVPEALEEAEGEGEIQRENRGLAIDIVSDREKSREIVQESKEDKSRKLQWLLQQLIRQTLQENNGQLCREIRESVVKELDYQFRMQEEREEARDRMLAERDEEHYKKMDELLRKKSRLKKEKRVKDTEKIKRKSRNKGQEKGQDESPDTDRDLEQEMAQEGKKRRFF